MHETGPCRRTRGRGGIRIRDSQAPQAPVRSNLPLELPRLEIRYEPDSTLCGCGCQMKRIGEDIAEARSWDADRKQQPKQPQILASSYKLFRRLIYS